MNENKRFSWLLWIPCVWMILSTSRFGGDWNINAMRTLTDADLAEGNPVLRNIFSSLIMIGFITLARRNIKWGEVFKENFWIFIIFTYMGLSAIWSVDSMLSIKRWVKTVGGLIMVLVVLSEKDPLSAVSALFRRVMSFLLIFSFVLIKFIPKYGIQTSEGYPSWVGLTSTKNNLGQIAVIGFIYFLWSLKNEVSHRKFDSAMLILSIYLLIGAKSTTSLFMAFIAGALFLLFEIDKINKRYVAVILFFCLIFSGITFLMVDEVFYNGNLVQTIVKMSGKDMTFTGRTDLWEDVLDFGAKKPMLGYGYGSFWAGDNLEELWEKYFWRPNQAHNGYIDVYVSMGLVGLVFLAFMFLQVFKNISNQFIYDNQFAKIRMIIFITIIAYNFTESSFCRLIHFLWFVFLLIAVSPFYFLKSRYLNEL